MRRYFYQIMTDQAQGFVASVLKIVLKGLSLLYAVIVTAMARINQFGWRRISLRRPVISIGNLTWGGVGKTPMVIFIVEYLRKRNIHPVVLMRGYKADLSGKNDEAAMMQADFPALPIVVHKNRLQGARQALLGHKTDVFLLDDGFQQWRIDKDFDIVMIDATNPFGNGSLLPRGILREPKTALARADLFVITKSDLGKNRLEFVREQLAKMNPKAPIVEAVHQPVAIEDIQDKKTFGLDWLKDQEVGLLCSIGDPQSFEKMVDLLGATIRKRFIFPDHHRYVKSDIEEIRRDCQQGNIEVILTTSKDENKLKIFPELWASHGRAHSPQVYVLRIVLMLVKGQDELARRIDHLLLR